MENTVLVLFLVTVTELPKLDWQLEKQAGEMIKLHYPFLITFSRFVVQ